MRYPEHLTGAVQVLLQEICVRVLKYPSCEMKPRSKGHQKLEKLKGKVGANPTKHALLYGGFYFTFLF